MSEKRIITVATALLFAFAIPYIGTKLYKKYNNSEIFAISQGSDRDVCIYQDGNYEIIDCEEYIVYALAGIYDEAWDEEMTRVMAVVLRTAVYYEMDDQADTANGGGKIINENDLTEIRYEESELKEKWGNNYRDNLQEIYNAVNDTAGLVIKYDNKLIIPMYHQISVGATVSAEEIYGTEIPYLVSVDSSQDINSPDFTSTKIYSEIRIKKEFGLTESDDISKEEESDDIYSVGELKITEATNSGFVKKVNVFGTKVSGEKFAEVLSLGTTNFHIDETDDGYRIICIGKGSSIGMSLYGAVYMAKNGSSYEEIITYYYQGAEITLY